MKNHKFLKVNLYIAFSVLFLSVAFWFLSETVHADDDKRVYVYYVDNNNIDANDWAKFYMEHNGKDESESVSMETQSKEKEKNKEATSASLSFTVLVLVLIPIAIITSILKNYLKNPTSSGLSLFGQFGDTDYSNEEPTDLVNVTIDESTKQEAESTDLVNVTIDESSNQEAEPTVLADAVIVDETEKATETVIENSVLLSQQNDQIEEESKKELTRQQLKDAIKNLDPIERNKFVELAKNGKTDEAINACVEVMGLGLTDAKKIIDLKLYY